MPSNRDALVLQRSTNRQELKSWFGDSGGQLDWGAINKTASDVEVDISEDDVRRCMQAMLPALFHGLRVGLQVQAKAAVDATINRMTGRLD